MPSILSRLTKNVFLLFIIVIVIVVLFLPGYTKLQDLKEKNRALDENIRKLNMENALLQGEIIRIQNDPLYQERIVRDKMGVVRKGEVLYKIEPPPASQSPQD
jgi:cell division protein FtsB